MDLRDEAIKYLSGHRLKHSIGVEKAAKELALFWGENVEDAMTAAIFHDITKKLNSDMQLKLCEKYNIIVSNVEKIEPKILHGKTAAAIAKYEFKLPQHIVQAINYHTTGFGNMTKLDKIIYIADYIEENRDFDGVETARKLAYESLDKAMLYSLEHTLKDLVARRRLIHMDTIQAINSLYILNVE